MSPLIVKAQGESETQNLLVWSRAIKVHFVNNILMNKGKKPTKKLLGSYMFKNFSPRNVLYFSRRVCRDCLHSAHWKLAFTRVLLVAIYESFFIAWAFMYQKYKPSWPWIRCNEMFFSNEYKNWSSRLGPKYLLEDTEKLKEGREEEHKNYIYWTRLPKIL